MANGTTMNAALFEALRDAGIDEGHAARVAKTVPPAETIATKAELESGLKDVRAEIPAAETLASKAEVKVLQADVGTTKGSIAQLAERVERLAEEMNKRFDDVAKRFDALTQDVNKRFSYLETAVARMQVVWKVAIGLLLAVFGFELREFFSG